MVKEPVRGFVALRFDAGVQTTRVSFEQSWPRVPFFQFSFSHGKNEKRKLCSFKKKIDSKKESFFSLERKKKRKRMCIPK